MKASRNTSARASSPATGSSPASSRPTLTSFLGRAVAHKQHFASFDEFLAAAKAGELKTGGTVDDWLPPELLQRAVESARTSDAKWSLESGPNKDPQIVSAMSDGTRLI